MYVGVVFKYLSWDIGEPARESYLGLLKAGHKINTKINYMLLLNCISFFCGRKRLQIYSKYWIIHFEYLHFLIGFVLKRRERCIGIPLSLFVFF